MENLNQYLEKLLARHDYVVVPGLGGFVVQFQSAEIHNNVILPPCAVVSFNPLMQHNDGLLAIEISRTEQISYRIAVESVNKFVVDIKSKLAADESVEVGNLGSFVTDESDNLIFTPGSIPAFLPQNLGLTSLNLNSDIQRKTKKKEIRITVSTSKFYKYAAAVLLVLGLFVSTPRVSDVRKSDYANMIPEFVQSAGKQTQATPTASQLKVESETKIKTQEVATQESEKNFHVIVASLPTKKSAENFCKKLTDSNFKNAQVLPPIRTYRIAIESFDSKDEAIRFMENLRKTDNRFKTAWVLCD